MSATPNPLIAAYQANQNAQAPALGTSIGVALPSAAPSIGPSLGTSLAPSVTQAPPTQTQTDQTERNRLINTGSGVDQISNPLLRGIAKTADIVGSVFAPNLAQFIPGTTLHHQLLVNQATNNVAKDQSEDESNAQTNNLNLQPQFKATQQALAQEKQNNTEDHQQAVLDQQQAHQQQQYVQNLRDHGYAPDETDPTGKAVRPLKYEEMSPTQQAVTDLKGSQDELASAKAALAAAQNNPNSPAYQLAKKRVDVAEQNAGTAAGKLGLQRQTVQGRLYGTDLQGNPLPGAMIADDGRTVGSAFQQNVRPTGTERNKGDLSRSADQQIDDMISIVKKDPNRFGPGYGQSTEFQNWLGSEDPDAKAFLSARTIASDHLAGTFGGHSEYATKALDDALGRFRDNPEAALAGLNQLKGANALFGKAGAVKTVGSNAAAAPSAAPPSTGTQAFTDGGTTYHIPAGQVADFKKDHPNAR